MKGFTLIELMVTITIIIVLSGASLATFVNYRDVRSTRDEAETVAERLRTIQIKATATEIPTGCTTVSNYVVSYGGFAQTLKNILTVQATCPGVGLVDIPSLSLTLTNSVFQNVVTRSVTFDSRTVSALAIPSTINICGNKKLFTITVSGSANVGKPVAAGSC